MLQVIAGTGAAAGPLFSQVKNRLKPFLSEKCLLIRIFSGR